MSSYLLPYTVGLASLTNGSAVVTGSLTAWADNVKPGDLLEYPAGEFRAISAVAITNTGFELIDAFDGVTAAGVAYKIHRVSPGWGATSDVNLRVADLLNALKANALSSVTSLTIGTGPQVFTVQAGFPVGPGAQMVAANPDAPENFMKGVVTAYEATSLTLDVQTVGGAGTFASWNISFAGDIGPQGDPGTDGTDGTNGTDGNDGWSPVFAVVSDGERRVLQVQSWVGGEGTPPASGEYVGATGLVALIGDAVDIRGAPGLDGTGAGTVTQVNTGAGLTGGPITATGTIAVDIAGQTEEAAPADADLFLMQRASDGLFRKVAASNLPGGGSVAMFNVMDYGADNTGATDSATAIQDTVDAAAAFIAADADRVGAAVYIPAGAYRIESQITANDPIHIFGDGWYQTQIWNASSNAHSFYFGDADPTANVLAGCGISSMKISYTPNDPTSAHGVYFDRCRDCFAHHLKIQNHFIGVGVYGGPESIMLDHLDISAGSNYTAAATGSALVKLDRREVDTGQGSQDAADSLYYDHPVSVYLSNSNLRGQATTFRVDYGLYLRTFDGLYVSNCHIGLTEQACVRFLPVQDNLSLINLYASSVFIDPLPGTTDYGIWYSTGGAGIDPTVRNHHWAGGTCSGAIHDGLLIGDENAQSIRFSAFAFSSNGRHGVDIAGACKDVTFDNCQFHGNNTVGSGNGGEVTAGENISFLGCSFRGATSYGIRIAGTADKCKIIGCNFEGTTNEAIEITATSRDHKVRDCQSDKVSNVAANSAITAPYEHDHITVTATGTGTINTVNGVLVGRELTIYLNVGAVVVSDGGGNMDLAGGLTSAGANDTIKIGSTNGTSWREISRAVN